MPPPDVKKSLGQWEGEIPYMYLDVEGYLTIGIGCRIFSLKQAQELEFIYRDDQPQKPGAAQRRKGERATAEDIAVDFQQVNLHKELKNNPYSFKNVTKLNLTPEALDNLFIERVKGFESQLRKTFSDYDAFPSSARTALLDLAFNVGSISGFPKLIEAVKKRDWETAAKESHRKPKDEKYIESFKKRNTWTAELFRKAAEEEKAAKEKQNPTTKTVPNTVETQPHGWYDPLFDAFWKFLERAEKILIAPRAQGRK